MDNDTAQTQAAGTRRKFLRQVGMGGAAVAALVGLTDLAGIPSALAETRSSPAGSRTAKRKSVRDVTAGPDADEALCTTITAIYSGGHCKGTAGAACPTNNCCYHFSGSVDGYAAFFNMCYPTNTGRANGCPSDFAAVLCPAN